MMVDADGISALELCTRCYPDRNESYHVMLGKDSVRVVYTWNTISYDAVVTHGDEAEDARRRIESIDLRSWGAIEYPPSEDGEHWDLAVLYDDGSVMECRGSVCGDVPPGYELLVETLMGLAGETYEED